MGEKYLAIKNWDVYQKQMGRRDYVKDSVDKDSDPEYSKLSAFCRYALDGLQRLRGRLGKNPHNDATWCARALLMLPTDRPHMRHAIDTLVAHGFLIPTNQQVGLIEEIRIQEIKEEKTAAAVVLKLALPKVPEIDGEAEFRKLLAVHPKPEDDQAAMSAFHERVVKNSIADKVPEAETLAKIHEAAGLYRRLSDEGMIDFIYPMGSWLRKGICNQNPETWKGRNRAKRSLLDYDELPEFQKPV